MKFLRSPGIDSAPFCVSHSV